MLLNFFSDNSKYILQKDKDYLLRRMVWPKPFLSYSKKGTYFGSLPNDINNIIHNMVPIYTLYFQTISPHLNHILCAHCKQQARTINEFGKILYVKCNRCNKNFLSKNTNMFTLCTKSNYYIYLSEILLIHKQNDIKINSHFVDSLVFHFDIFTNRGIIRLVPKLSHDKSEEDRILEKAKYKFKF